MKSTSNEEHESKIVLKKLIINLVKFFWDSHSDKIKEDIKNFETLSDSSLRYLERSIGIVNPLDHNDWLEVVFILLAQVSKRTDDNGSVCLRPS